MAVLEMDVQGTWRQPPEPSNIKLLQVVFQVHPETIPQVIQRGSL
jgi:hypothetical protein